MAGVLKRTAPKEEIEIDGDDIWAQLVRAHMDDCKRRLRAADAPDFKSWKDCGPNSDALKC